MPLNAMDIWHENLLERFVIVLMYATLLCKTLWYNCSAEGYWNGDGPQTSHVRIEGWQKKLES